MPFFDGNGSSGYLANLTGGSGGELQVVSGSGDATQGNIGAGVINIVPPRGTYPATGGFSALVDEPYYNHQLSLELLLVHAEQPLLGLHVLRRFAQRARLLAIRR